jgi:hypothetical protein
VRKEKLWKNFSNKQTNKQTNPKKVSRTREKISGENAINKQNKTKTFAVYFSSFCNF